MRQAASFNTVCLMGFIPSDFWPRLTRGGVPYSYGNVGIPDRWFSTRTGKVTNNINYIPVYVWATNIQRIQPYLTKGTTISLVGKLMSMQFGHEDDRGKQWRLCVHTRNLQIVSHKAKDAAWVNNTVGAWGSDSHELPKAIAALGKGDNPMAVHEDAAELEGAEEDERGVEGEQD